MAGDNTTIRMGSAADQAQPLSALEWRAFCYVTGDLSAEETVGFEADLQAELAAGETTLADCLARMSELAAVVRSAAATLPASTPQEVRPVAERSASRHAGSGRPLPRRMSLIAACGLAGLGAWWLSSPSGSRPQPLSGEQRALVAAWIEADVSRSTGIAESSDDGLTGLVAEATPEAPDEEAGTSSTLEVPAWLAAAVAANEG